MLRGPVAIAALTGLALVLSGCTADKAADANPLFGWCPQWVQGPGEHTINLRIDGSTTSDERTLLPPGMTFSGNGTPSTFHNKPLDLYRISIDSVNATGVVQLRVFDQNGTQLAIRDYRQESVQVIPLATIFADDDGALFDVALTSVSHDDAPKPGPLTVRWTLADGGEAAIAFTATYHYKVCGAQVGP